MYNYIKGILVKYEVDRIIVENNDIGYEIMTTVNSIQDYEENSEIKVFTRQIIKDEEILLIGFTSMLELEMFDLLRTVSGVGIKSALNVLNTLNINFLVNAIIEEDYNSLTTVSGIGKKTAQRMIIELKDKFTKEFENYSIEMDKIINNDLDNSEILAKRSEIRNALLSLGYTSSEINHVLKQLDFNSLEIEDIIKESLKILMRG